MQVLLGPLVTAAAGSIRGSTFQRHNGTTIVRAKPLPTKRYTPAASAITSVGSYLSRAWGQLTQVQRDAWSTQALAMTWFDKFGNVIPGKGYWLFLRCNQYTRLLLSPFLTAPGPLTPLDAIIGMSGDFTAVNTWPVTWSLPSPSSALGPYFIYASRWQSNGKGSSFGAQRLIGYIPALTANSFDLWPQYVARFGAAPPSGQRVFATARQIDQNYGYSGPPFSWIANT